MKYKIIKDSDKLRLSEWRDEYVRFTIYPNINVTESDKLVTVNQLQEYIVQPYVTDKSKRNCILFNPSYFKGDFVRDDSELISGKKTLNHLYLPNTVMVDIDFKSKDSRIQLKKDMGLETFKESYLKLLEMLMLDECLLYIDTSHSNGIKCFYNVISDFYIDNCDDVIYNFEVDKYVDDIQTLTKQNMLTVFKYMEDKFGIKYHDIKEIDYIDSVGFRPTQVTYSSKGKWFKINPNANLIYNLTPYFKVERNKSVSNNKLTNDERTINNNRFCEEFFNKVKDGNDEVNEIVDSFFKKEFSHYNEKYFFSMYFLDVKYLKIFYRLYCKYYKSSTMQLSSFDKFYNYVHKIEPKYNIKMKTLMYSLYESVNKVSNVKINVKINNDINIFRKD